MKILYKMPDYLRRLETCDPARLRWVKVIRDPYKRAVSSFEHSLINSIHQKDMSVRLGREINPDAGFSFHEFLDYVEIVGVDRVNPHVRAQLHPIEAVIQPHLVINIDREELTGALNRFAGAPPMEGYPLMAAEVRRISSFHYRRRERLNQDCFDRVFVGSDPHVIWPAYDDFLTEAARKKIERIYACDFEAYASFW